jgi:hypothetical protein
MEEQEKILISTIEQLSWLNKFLHYTGKGTDAITIDDRNMEITIKATILTHSTFELLLDKVKAAVEESKEEINTSMQIKYNDKLSELKMLISNK